jgi:hypothetical protein
MLLPPSILACVSEAAALNQQGAYLLCAWVVLNFLVSGWLGWRASGFIRSFHTMNLGWNLVNLALVIFTLLNLSAPPATLPEVLGQQYFNEKIYLFNAGLDVGYLMLGLFLGEKSKSSQRAAMLKGFGHSVVLQGMFLLVFDWVMFYLHTGLTHKLLLVGGF